MKAGFRVPEILKNLTMFMFAKKIISKIIGVPGDHADFSFLGFCNYLNCWKFAFVVLFFYSIFCEGSEFYSYRDLSGKTIIVDTLDKVPEELRRHVKNYQIKKFQEAEPKIEPETASGSDNRLVVLEFLPDSPPSGIVVSGNASAAISSHEQIASFDLVIASATLWISGLKQIQGRGDQIWMLSKSGGVLQNRQIIMLHQQSLLDLENLRSFESMIFPGNQQWLDKAIVLTNQFRTLEWTISRWLQMGPNHVSVELPGLLNRTRGLLDDLSSALAGIKAP